MSCRICGRSSCTEFFHRLEEQMLFDEYKEHCSDMSFNEWKEYQDEKASG